MAGIGDIGGLAMGANPYAGAAEMGVGLIKGITESVAASKQAERAQALREEAKNVQKQAIRPEFLAAQRNAQLQSSYGLAGMQGYRDKINGDLANSVRAIKESSPNGEATLAAISSTFANANKSNNDLSIQDSQAQERKGINANQIIWNVGEQQRGLEDRRDAEKRAILGQAGALENAATANKQTGINDALGGVEQGASQLFKKNTDDGSSTPAPQNATTNIPVTQGNQIPSSGGFGSIYGLSPLPLYQGGQPQMKQMGTQIGDYQRISPTPSNYNWSIYQ